MTDGTSRQTLIADMIEPYLFAQRPHRRTAALECAQKVEAALAAREDTAADAIAELEVIGNFLAAGSFTTGRVAIMRRRVDALLAREAKEPTVDTDRPDDEKVAREALAMIEALGRDALETPQELALRARSALRLRDTEQEHER